MGLSDSNAFQWPNFASTDESTTTASSSTTATGTNSYIGMAVGSGSDTTLNTSHFSNARVTF